MESLQQAAAAAAAALAPQYVARAQGLAQHEAQALLHLRSSPETRAKALLAGLLSLSEVDAAAECDGAGEGQKHEAEEVKGGEDGSGDGNADGSDDGSDDDDDDDPFDAFTQSVCARLSLLHMATALVSVAEARGRKRELEAAFDAACAAALSMGDWEERVAHAAAYPEALERASAAFGKARRFERACFNLWALVARRLHGAESEASIHALGVERGVWIDRLQRPVELLHKVCARVQA